MSTTKKDNKSIKKIPDHVRKRYDIFLDLLAHIFANSGVYNCLNDFGSKHGGLFLDARNNKSFSENINNWIERKHAPKIIDNKQKLINFLLYVEAFRYTIDLKADKIKCNDSPECFCQNLDRILNRLGHDKLNVMDSGDFFVLLALKQQIHNGSSVYQKYVELKQNVELRTAMSSVYGNEETDTYTSNIEKEFEVVSELGDSSDQEYDNTKCKDMTAFQFAKRYAGVFDRTRKTKLFVWSLLINKQHVESETAKDDDLQYPTAFQELMDYFREKAENPLARIRQFDNPNINEESNDFFAIDDFYQDIEERFFKYPSTLSEIHLSSGLLKKIVEEDYKKFKLDILSGLNNPEQFVSYQLMLKWYNMRLLKILSSLLKLEEKNKIQGAESELERNRLILEIINKKKGSASMDAKIVKAIEQEEKLFHDLSPTVILQKNRKALSEKLSYRREKLVKAFFEKHPKLESVVYGDQLYDLLEQETLSRENHKMKYEAMVAFLMSKAASEYLSNEIIDSYCCKIEDIKNLQEEYNRISLNNSDVKLIQSFTHTDVKIYNPEYRESMYPVLYEAEWLNERFGKMHDGEGVEMFLNKILFYSPVPISQDAETYFYGVEDLIQKTITKESLILTFMENVTFNDILPDITKKRGEINVIDTQRRIERRLNQLLDLCGFASLDPYAAIDKRFLDALSAIEYEKLIKQKKSDKNILRFCPFDEFAKEFYQNQEKKEQEYTF